MRIDELYLEIIENVKVEGKDEDMQESSVDFPQVGLCSLVWDRIEEGEYVIKPAVEKQIYDVLSKYPYMNLLDLADEIHIIGSIGTNQYTDDADIDIHLDIDPAKMSKDKSVEDWQKDIRKWYKDNAKDIGAFVGSHPIEVYYQLKKSQEFLADALYDLKNHKWLKGPKLTELSFNPYERYKDIVDSVAGIVGDADTLIAELKRDVIDYDVVKDAIRKAPVEVKAKLKELLSQKLQEIELGINELLKTKKEWVEMRQHASSPTSPEQAMSDIELAKKWENMNALFKFLSRYQYMKLISELEKMIEDQSIDDKEIGQIKKLLGVMNNDSEYHSEFQDTHTITDRV